MLIVARTVWFKWVNNFSKDQCKMLQNHGWEKTHSMKTEQWIAMCSGMDICTKEIFPHLAGKVIKIPFLFPTTCLHIATD